MENNSLPYLTEDEIRRAQGCVRNIKDKLNAIETELNNQRPYRRYLKEKIDSILWDSNCIKSMTEEEE